MDRCGGIPVARAMLTEFRTLTSRDSLARAVDLILAGSQQDFPVVEDGRVVGVLTRGDLLIALAQRGHREKNASESPQRKILMKE
jgi:hypothetical protein